MKREKFSLYYVSLKQKRIRMSILTIAEGTSKACISSYGKYIPEEFVLCGRKKPNLFERLFKVKKNYEVLVLIEAKNEKSFQGNLFIEHIMLPYKKYHKFSLMKVLFEEHLLNKED